MKNVSCLLLLLLLGLRYSGKEDVVDTNDPHEMYGYFLQNQTLRSEQGKPVNGWAAHRACMGKRDAGGVCDSDTYTHTVYEDDFTANNSLTLLRRRPRDRPFFLQINFPGPHPPCVTPKQKEIEEEEERRRKEGRKERRRTERRKEGNVVLMLFSFFLYIYG